MSANANQMSEMNLNTILTYGIHFEKNTHEWITIEATRFDETTNQPVTWAVRLGRSVMSNITGDFDYEPMPSSRDDDFFKEYRFSSPEEAAKCWEKHYAKVVA